MRLRRRAGGLLLGAAVLFVIGTNVRAGWLFVLAALLVGAVLAGIALPATGLRGLEAELAVPDEVEQLAEALVELRITNRARRTRWDLVVGDDHLEAVRAYAGTIAPRGWAEVTTLRRSHRRGPVETTSATVRSSAPFGVAERRRSLPVNATTLVLPRVFPLDALPFIEPAGTNERAIHPEPRRGGGPDYLGVREYRAGDSLRHVHWPSTARTGTVMVRDFEREQTRRLMLIVDTQRDEGDGWTPLDRCCAVAASICEAASAHGHGVRLAAASESGEVDVLVRADEAEQLRWLAMLKGTDRSMNQVVEGLDPATYRGVETVVFALAGAHAADAVERIARRVTRTVCVLVDEVEGSSAPAALRAAGADVYVWDDGADLAECLSRTEGGS